MAVFRVERNKGYTVMSNHHLRNKELSLKANLGLTSVKMCTVLPYFAGEQGCSQKQPCLRFAFGHRYFARCLAASYPSLCMWEKYERNKGTRRQFDKMKPGRKKEQFEQKHGAELALYEAAVRYLEKLKANGEEITPKKWQAEADRLKAEKSVQYQKMKAMREDIKAVENLKKTAEQLARTENEPARKKEEQEL